MYIYYVAITIALQSNVCYNFLVFLTRIKNVIQYIKADSQ